MVYLKEAFINEFADPANDATDENIEVPDAVQEEQPGVAAIQGLDAMYPFDTANFTIDSAQEGTWSLSNNKAKINSQTTNEVSITIISSKSGSVDLIYIENEEPIVKTITIKSL